MDQCMTLTKQTILSSFTRQCTLSALINLISINYSFTTYTCVLLLLLSHKSQRQSMKRNITVILLRSSSVLHSVFLSKFKIDWNIKICSRLYFFFHSLDEQDSNLDRVMKKRLVFFQNSFSPPLAIFWLSKWKCFVCTSRISFETCLSAEIHSGKVFRV